MNFKSFLFKSELERLKKALIGIFNIDGVHNESNKPTQKETESFWSDKRFLGWLGRLGVNVQPGNVPEYKDGGVGRAYLLPDKVVKFTDNKIEANVANMLVGKSDVPAMIYGVYKVPGEKMYAILSEKYDIEFTPTLIKMSDYVTAYFDSHDISSFSNIPKDRDEMARNVADENNLSYTLIPFIRSVIESLYKLYVNTGYFHDDAVPQNLAMSNKGELMVVDLGPNQTKVFDPKSAMKKIHFHRKQIGLEKYKQI